MNINLRLTAVISALILLLLLGKWFPRATVFCFLVVFTGLFALDVYHRIKLVRWVTVRPVIRWIRSIYKSLSPPPIASILYSVTFVVAGLSFFIFTIAREQFILSIAGGLQITLLCLATVCDWNARIKFAFRFHLTRSIFKWLLAFFATASIFIASWAAKQLIYSVSLADPSALSDSVRLMTVGMYPLALVLILLLIFNLYFLYQYISLLVFMVVSMTLRYIGMGFAPKLWKGWQILFFRLCNGKRPPESLPLWRLLSKNIHHVARLLGTVSMTGLIGMIWCGFSAVVQYVPVHWMHIGLVYTEYRHPHLCDNVASTSRIAFQADGYVSVATQLPTGYIFSLEKCHK
jgi:hypothetical protein